MDYKLFEILVCPCCKAKLNYKKGIPELICTKCKLAYPIDDGIPVMLAEQAREVEDNDK
jgi:uncharacterized protein YbaR (Trm112 family)